MEFCNTTLPVLTTYIKKNYQPISRGSVHEFMHIERKLIRKKYFRDVGGHQVVSLSLDWSNLISKLTYPLEYLPPDGQCVS